MTDMSARLRRAEAAAGRQGSQARREAVIAADEAGTADLGQYARRYRELVEVRRLVLLSCVDVILARQRSCCADTVFDLIAIPPDMPVPDHLSMSWTMVELGATEIWVGNNWWVYLSRELIYLDKEHWPTARAEFAVSLLAADRPGVRLEGMDFQPASYALGIREDAFERADGDWGPSPAVYEAKERVAALGGDWAEHVEPLLALLCGAGECRCEPPFTR